MAIGLNISELQTKDDSQIQMLEDILVPEVVIMTVTTLLAPIKPITLITPITGHRRLRLLR